MVRIILLASKGNHETVIGIRKRIISNNNNNNNNNNNINNINNNNDDDLYSSVEKNTCTMLMRTK